MSEANGAVDWQKIARELYKMLDWIDTFDDMAKDNEEAYRAAVRREHKKRFKYHSLFDPDGDVSKFNQPPS